MNEKMTEDRMTSLIVDRLGERQQKLDKMAAWESKTKMRRVRLVYWGTAIAACVAVFLLVLPTNHQRVSPLDEMDLDYNVSEEFRAASPEIGIIMSLIEKADYEKAIGMVQFEIQLSDQSVQESYALWNEAKEESGKEEYEYDYRLSMLHNSELRWLYIWLLVRVEDYSKAEEQLEIYLEHKDFCTNVENAQRLLQTIKDR